MLSLRLYMVQRVSALLMVPLVFGHIIVMIVAIDDGLTAAEILERTRGSLAWFLFYGTFVLAVSVHGAIGLRVIVHEMLALKGRALDFMTLGVAIVLLGLGARAVWAVIFSESLSGTLS